MTTWQPTTSFVGRESDLRAIEARLEEGRLVTVLGPGGMGKTRLALRFAAERAREAFAEEGGVHVVDLTEAKSEVDIGAAVAAAIGAPADDQPEAIGAAIARHGRVLLVIDNFDNLVAHAQATIGAWMHAAPSARFVVTSRTALGISGEQLWALGPLSVDEAVELFANRAGQVQPSFDASRERKTVERIVTAVDCMPLALELAATRMTVLSATQLDARLGRPLDILAGNREVPRHQSIRRTIVDSLELLDERTRRVFASLSLLKNGFTLEAAEAALAEPTPVMDDLDALVRSSLLRVTQSAGDSARHSFFETIRDVAEELAAQFLASSERDAVRARAAKFYAEHAARHRGMATLAADLDNLLAAHATGCASSMPETLDVVLGVEALLSARGQNRLLVMLVDAALDRLASTDAARGAEAHLVRGRARGELGDAALARADFERARDLAREAALPEITATALTRLAAMLDQGGDTHAARALFDEALGLLRDAPSSTTKKRREAEAYLGLGHALRRESVLDAARTAIVRASELYRSLDDAEGLASALYEHAVVEMFAGDHEGAMRRFDEGLEVSERGGVRVFYGACKTARGCLLQDLGRLDDALEHHAEAARTFHELGGRYREASALYYLATTYLERDEPTETLAIIARARRALEGTTAVRYEALMAGCTASAHAMLRDFASAHASLAEAESAAAKVTNEPALATNVALHRLALDAREHDAKTNVDLAAAEARVAASATDDSRFALRMLRRAISTEPAKEKDDGLVIAADGGWFRLPSTEEKVPIPARSPLRRILLHLASRRIEASGEVVTIDDVIRVGWPDEKIAAEAALNRAHVALASLRKMGLRDLLVRTSGGYALSEAVVVRIKGD